MEAALLPPPPPEEAAPVDREVPLTEVLALDEMLLVLVLDSTFDLALAVEEGDSAENEFTLDRGDELPTLAAASAEVEDAEDAVLLEDEGVNSEFPVEADPPAPAAEDEPAVFDVATEEELPLNED